MKTQCLVFAAAWLACGALPAVWGQAGATEGYGLPTLKLEARIVPVAAVVQDKAGKPVGGLGKADFVLKVDGHPGEIRYFSQGSDLPLTLALLVDTSGSQRTLLADEEEASMVFFQAMLTRPGDRASLVQFDNNVVQLESSTGSVENLQRGLGYLAYPHPSALPGNRPGTLLYDAVVQTCERGAGGPGQGAERGRRALVLLTDGEDNGSRATLAQAIAAAERANLPIYAVYYAAGRETMGGFTPAPGPGLRALAEMTKATGGRLFEAQRPYPLRQIFAEIGEDLRLEYDLGYSPPAGEAVPGSYHRLDLKTTDKKLRVQARRGYYTPESASTAAASKR